MHDPNDRIWRVSAYSPRDDDGEQPREHMMLEDGSCTSSAVRVCVGTVVGLSSA